MLSTQLDEPTRFVLGRMGLHLLVVTFLSATLGCSTMGSLEPMEVTLTDLEVT